jgi:hypothetical protein
MTLQKWAGAPSCSIHTAGVANGTSSSRPINVQPQTAISSVSRELCSLNIQHMNYFQNFTLFIQNGLPLN